MPDTTSRHLDAWDRDGAHARITRLIASPHAAPRCPGGEVPARDVHRHDTRRRAELPWRGDAITWQLRVRTRLCSKTQGPRRGFTERLPGVVAPWARRTLRLMARRLAVALGLGGAAGGRLSQSFGLTVSRNPWLRVIRRAPCPAVVSPQILSVDEFALRTHHPSGTILVDLERRQPLARLPDREAATVAAWLEAHPGVAAVVRERAAAYAEAARLGAPAACQVADRFHRLQTRADVLTDVFRAHAPPLARVKAERTQAPMPGHDPADPATGPRRSTVPLAPPQPSARALALAAARRAQRVATDEQVWSFPRQGWTLDALAHQVGLSRRTVRRDPPEPDGPRTPTAVEP